MAIELPPITEQERFEERIFSQYFLSTIQRNPNPPMGTGAMDLVSVDCKTKAEFLVKNPDGTYESDTVNAAWWGWQASLKERLP